jgi:hypothetical protein
VGSKVETTPKKSPLLPVQDKLPAELAFALTVRAPPLPLIEAEAFHTFTLPLHLISSWATANVEANNAKTPMHNLSITTPY